MSIHIEIIQLAHANGLPLPRYASEGSAGLDLIAAVTEDMILLPGQTVPIPSGIVIALPDGLEGQVRPRSGLAMKHSIGIMNAPGTIDSDYRGEIKVLLTNFGTEPFTVRRGERIAQLVIARYEKIDWEISESLPETYRGEGGFGHTGR